MVFDCAAAPNDRAEFMAWYRKQTEWEEQHGYDHPKVCSVNLNAWFLEINQAFPAMNGPFASDDVDDPKVTDYSIGSAVIYGAFAWSQANDAYHSMFEMARKHGVGFFDVSAENGQVWMPNAAGEYVCVHEG